MSTLIFREAGGRSRTLLVRTQQAAGLGVIKVGFEKNRRAPFAVRPNADFMGVFGMLHDSRQHPVQTRGALRNRAAIL